MIEYEALAQNNTKVPTCLSQPPPSKYNGWICFILFNPMLGKWWPPPVLGLNMVIYWSMQDALIVDSTQNHPILHFQNNKLLKFRKIYGHIGNWTQHLSQMLMLSERDNQLHHVPHSFLGIFITLYNTSALEHTYFLVPSVIFVPCSGSILTLTIQSTILILASFKTYERINRKTLTKTNFYPRHSSERSLSMTLCVFFALW